MLFDGDRAGAEGCAQAAVDALPKHVLDILNKAKHSWLRNTEIAELLRGYQRFGFQVSAQAPFRPPSGSVFLFDRTTLRFFRKDGYRWRKKADGRTIREAHEKLKVENKDVLNCYYAQSEEADGLQRRCYWLLEGSGSTVLVHYLAAKQPGKDAVPDKHAEYALQSLTDEHEESSQTLDAPPPFSVASLFPPKACQPSTPKAKQPQLCQQQLSVVSDNQTDSMQATCLDTPSPIFLRRQQSVSTSPPMSRQHGPSSSSPAQGSIILCGKPLSLNSRTASAPSSTFQDQPFSFRQHQPPVKRTWSDSTQYVQRNLSHYASLGQEQCNRSLSAHKARGAGEHIVPEFQHPAKKHQVEVDGRPSFPLWPDQHLTANQQSRTDEQARTDQHSRAMHPLPEQARRQSGQLSQPQQTGELQAQQPSHDRAVPTMSPASLRSPRHQTKLSTHPSSGRLKAAESQAMHFHPQKSNSTLTVQHRAYTNQLPSQLQLQPSTRFQLKPGTQLHSDRQLRSQQSQMLPQSGSYCHLQSLSESDSALHSSPHNSSQSQRPQKCPESQRQLHGIFSQQPLTPGCRATAPRHSFAFSFQGSSGSYSPDEGSSLFGSPEESSTGASSSPCRSLTAHLVAQQQKGLLQRTTGRLHLPFPPQSATPQQMPLPSPGAKQHAPGLMGCPFEKHFGVHRISDASTNWMEHMTPDLPPFEATVPHATDYIATDFRSAVIDDLQGLSAVDLSV